MIHKIQGGRGFVSPPSFQCSPNLTSYSFGSTGRVPSPQQWTCDRGFKTMSDLSGSRSPIPPPPQKYSRAANALARFAPFFSGSRPPSPQNNRLDGPRPIRSKSLYVASSPLHRHLCDWIIRMKKKKKTLEPKEKRIFFFSILGVYLISFQIQIL